MRNRFLTKFSALVLLGVSSLPAWAADYVPKNISGGWVRRVVEAPSAPGTFYAASYGIFKSTDGGQTWTSKPYGDPPPAVVADNGGQLFGRHCTNSVAVSPSDPNLVIVGDELWSPIWRSTDGGNTWACVMPGGGNWGSANWKRTAVVASSYPNTNTSVFLASIEPAAGGTPGPWGCTLYESVDAGLTWAPTTLSLPNNQSITDIMLLPGGRIVAAVADKYLGFVRDNGLLPASGRVRYSDDNGATFQTATGMTDAAYKMTWDSANNRLWLMTADAKIYWSADGASWTQDGTTALGGVSLQGSSDHPTGILFSAGAGSAKPSLMAFFNNNSGNAVNIYRTAVDVLSNPMPWYQVTLPTENQGKELVLLWPYDLVVDSRSLASNTNQWAIALYGPGLLYTATTPLGFSASMADFSRQTGITTPFIRYGARDLATNRMYTLADAGVFFSPDDGMSWNLVYPPTGVRSAQTRFVAFDPTPGSHQEYLVADIKILVTNNDGTDTFSNPPVYDFATKGYSVSANIMSNLLINPANSQEMLIGVGNSATAATGHYLYQSSDGGGSWAQVTSLPPVHGVYYLAMDPANTNTVYAGCGDCSAFGGAYFAGHGDGLYRTTDGSTWSVIGNFSGKRIDLINIDTLHPQNILVGFASRFDDPVSSMPGSKLSTDGGATWVDVRFENMSGSHPFGDTKSFFVDNAIYCGQASGEIDGGLIADGGVIQTLALMPTDVNWIFKGSVLAATGSGLYNLLVSPQANPTRTPTPNATPTPGGPGNGPVDLFGKTVVAYPNPGKDQVTFIFNLGTQPNDVKVSLFNLRGERAAVLAGTLRGSGAKLVWECGSVAPGIYVAKVSVNGLETVKMKVAVVR